MKVLVCGSRHFKDEQFVFDTLDKYDAEFEITTIIEGEAKGPDKISAKWAEDVGVPTLRFPAHWTADGRRAGPIRNQRMLDVGQPDIVIAFWDGQSAGTGHMLNVAEKAGVPVKVINI